MTSSRPPLHVALLGATGASGQVALEVLQERELPLASLKLLDAGSGAGRELEFRGETLRVEKPSDAAFEGCDVALFLVDAEVSREWAPRATAKGCVVVDDSAAFRADPEVPLVVPEVNPEALAGYEARSLVASPASTSTFAALVLKPLLDAAGLERVVAATYQAVSGAGQEGVEQLEREAQALMNGRDPGPPTCMPHRIAFNLVPQVGLLDAGGHSEQERKLRDEPRRLLGRPELRVAATAVRVPLFYGHAIALNVETSRKLTAADARERLRHSPGVKVVDDPGTQVYPMPMLAVNDDAVLVGRIREDSSHERALDLFAVGDNLRKGAATNVVQIAELLWEKYL